MLIQKPKGTYDLLPEKAFQRTSIENKIRSIFSDFNYNEIRTPAFEKTLLFKRGIGEETDIVSKEMYSFNDGEFTLKPEMTAPVIRAYLENSLYNESPLQKLYYISNMFRRERPQAGRFREFSQFGAEAIGSADYLVDAEMILLADSILKSLGIRDVKIRINTIGTLAEREIYLKEFKNYLSKYLNELSGDSQRRFEKNPLRILDSKSEKDNEILKDAPVLYEFLNENTKKYFEDILSLLGTLNVDYQTDYKLVRGFDYYTSTTFEFVSDALGAQNSLLGGGRYDLLTEQLGGKPAPAIGFAAGFERLMMVLENSGFNFPEEKKLNLFIVSMDEESKITALKLITALRAQNVKCDTDYLNRSVKSQMKEANRMNAEYVLVLGEDEIRSNSGKIKRMSDGNETEIPDILNINSDLFKVS
ncbi:MAG TPA: histidine--tRNA ligase [Ignavibacteria bacterium]|nr:histidine--tRNA ligase [Ignavibacteria bacterium]HMR39192.1 histidine--tRNA ligase [Ignavibacteria bacterium]